MTDIETLRRHEVMLARIHCVGDALLRGEAIPPSEDDISEDDIPDVEAAIAWALDAVRKAIAEAEREAERAAARARGECLFCGFAPCLCDQQ